MNENKSKIITIKIDDFFKHHINFTNKINNTIISGFFSKIKYSNSIFALNMLIINLPIELLDNSCTEAMFKCIFEKLKKIEYDILDVYKNTFNISTKIAKYKLQLNILKFKKMQNDTKNGYLLLKITGIWENDNEYGLIYKIYYYTSV